MLLQNPFEFAASDAAAEQAAASIPCPHAQDAAAAPFVSAGVSAASPVDEADASLWQTSGASADISCIGEIFVGARKLEQLPGIFDQAAITGRDELLYVTLKLMDEPHERDLPRIPDEQAFMDAIDEPPLFLRQASA